MNEKQIIETIAKYSSEYNKGFNEKQIDKMVQYLIKNPNENKEKFIKNACELHLK